MHKMSTKRFTSIIPCYGIKGQLERSTHVVRVEFRKVPQKWYCFTKFFLKDYRRCILYERSQNSPGQTFNAIQNM